MKVKLGQMNKSGTKVNTKQSKRLSLDVKLKPMLSTKMQASNTRVLQYGAALNTCGTDNQHDTLFDSTPQSSHRRMSPLCPVSK
jgi:hypothetical protein